MPVEVNAKQIEYWNSPAGENWITYEENLDAAFSAVNRRVLERAEVQAGERIIDIGCGAGSTSLAAVEAVGKGGYVLAVDVSRPLLERASQRAHDCGVTNIRHELADAQIYPFEPGSFDLVVSRFGVMFFSDPVAAFANMAKALKPGGRLSIASWATIEVNPWFKIPYDAAVARLGEPEPQEPYAPSPWAFRDIDRVTDILTQAGLSPVRGDEEQVELLFPGTAQDAARLASNLGPAMRIAKEKNATVQDVEAIAEAIERAVAGFQVEGAVRFPARLNFFSAVGG